MVLLLIVVVAALLCGVAPVYNRLVRGHDPLEPGRLGGGLLPATLLRG